jgi:hypothetical protein
MPYSIEGNNYTKDEIVPGLMSFIVSTINPIKKIVKIKKL